MSRFDDIAELLQSVEIHIADVDAFYADAVNNEDAKFEGRAKLKSSLEHLRSCLEYCAQETHARLFGGKRDRLYFPYSEHEKGFKISVANNLPGLEKRSKVVYALYEQAQPHKTGRNWLPKLCKHTNAAKHNSLPVIDRINSPGRVTLVPGFMHLEGTGHNLIFKDSWVNGKPVGHGLPVEINGNTPVRDIGKHLGMKASRTFDWVEFRFPGTPDDTRVLIKEAHKEIGVFSLQLKGLLP